jgi:uncharacterized membrane protein YraQ (UPF0718 family)
MKFNLKNISGSWYFLCVVIAAYLILPAISPELFLSSAKFFHKIILKIIPVFLLVFALMAFVNYFITPKKIIKHFEKKGFKKWIYVIISGILSTGPIYLWYPLLADLKKKGLSYGLIACFLYNRAIKLPLIPLAVLYFGWAYIIILSSVMILISIIQGLLINKLMKAKI